MLPEKDERMPTLDGWRGIAIILVLIDHSQPAFLGHYAGPWSQTGAHGVTIFFVLSGFLITSKLTGRPINLKRFYLRRIFRLMPAAWVYLAALFVFDGALGSRMISLPKLAGCVFFFRNFLSDSIATQHFWSLSVEEQYYLAWPFVLLLVGARRCKLVCIAGAVGCAYYRWRNWASYDHPVANFRTEVRADALLIGCLLALLLNDEDFRRRARKWSRIASAPALAVLVYCMANFGWLPPLSECCAIAVLIAASLLNPTTWMARPLSFAPLAWLGTISYSAYLWQQLFLMRWGTLQIGMFGIVFPAFALMSYYWIERPCVELGRRLFEVRAPREFEKIIVS